MQNGGFVATRRSLSYLPTSWFPLSSATHFRHCIVPSSAARIKEATVDNRHQDALTSFSGWWRSWTLLAGGRDTVDHRRTDSDLDESAHFLIWASELAAPGKGVRGRGGSTLT